MAAATTTLPLFWNLASANKGERIDASVKLITALQQFQEQHKAVQKEKEPTPSEPEEDEEQNENSADEANEDNFELKIYSAKLDSDNAPDVAYAIRRLLRGLASPRESSRLGFAVGLTELLSRIDTVTCEQVIVLLRSFSRTSGSMSGQEERDILFARLFGLKSIVQSGILFDQRSLRLSSGSLSSLKGFEAFLTELLELGERKSWLRESCWWTLLSAINVLYNATVPWREDAYAILLERVYVKDKSWSPEKVALTLRLQIARPDADWRTFCDSYFKGSDILSMTNLSLLGRLLKTSASEGTLEDDTTKHSTEPWKPQLHFVWDIILDTLLNEENSASTRSFQDFYRVVVDETLFSSSSSPQRRYWGFLAFQKALHRVPKEHLPLLFTKNFMRTWINQLSRNDRYLHKIALQVAADVQHIVEKDPKVGFTLVLQLTGTNGSYQFDRLTKTKTVETILSNTDNSGIKEYVDYLFQQVNEGEQDDALASVGARRSWIIEQLVTIVRKGSIPKTDENLQVILDWLATHSFFNVIKKSSKGSNIALHRVPVPPFSDEHRRTCRTKLLSCLGDLTSSSTPLEKSEVTKTVKLPGVASDGEFWISRVLKTILDLEQDRKHVIYVHQLDDADFKMRKRALSLIEKIKARRTDDEVAHGAELLLSALTLRCLCEPETDWEEVQECAKQFTRLFAPVEPSERKKNKEEKESASEDGGERPPVDLIVDTIIGLLEQSTNFTRIVANTSFSMLSSLVESSTVDLILAQLERRDPTEETMEEDMENTGSDVSSESGSDGDDDDDDDESQDGTSSASSSEQVADEEETEALRKALQAAVSGKHPDSNGGEPGTSSDEESMDDEQMMAIDEKLAAVFQSKAQERRKGKDTGAQREATYFKNRVLDLVEIYMKKQSSNPLFLRFVLPLVELVATASSDEKQLSDKAKGILRARLSKAKDAVRMDDASKASELLESLHWRARRAHSQEVVSIISICSLFVAKALIASDEEAVLKIYKESISDFITRKTSSLNASFITDFIRRHPLLAWSIRSHLVEMLNEAANGFRQTQAFGILHIMYRSLPQPESRKDEIMSFAVETSKAFLVAMNKSCVAEKPLTNSAQLKQLLKTALAICRFIRRYAAGSELEEAWVPEEWEKLTSNLASSENFKVATSLPNSCQQISKLIRNDDGNFRGSAKNAGQKRKQEAEEQSTQDDGSGSRKSKRKKIRKATKSSGSRPTI